MYPPGSRHSWLGSGDGSLCEIDVTTGTPASEPERRGIVLVEGGGGVGGPSYDVVEDLLHVGTGDGAIYADAVRAPFP